MSILAKDTNLPSFTLRKHKESISATEFINVRIQKDPLVLKPYLISIDERGLLILWDLATRRPILEHQAHSTQVMTIKQLGIDDDGEEYCIIEEYYGLIVTHGRDNLIKIWRLFNEINEFNLEQVYEIPVNSLNFSNIDILNEFLITPNTLNSNFFDIYDISFISSNNSFNEFKLKRIFNGIDLYKLSIDQGFEFTEFQINNDDEVNRVDKLGIIMKFLWIDHKTLFIGFESGHVLQIEVGDDIRVVSISQEHFPDPVLSLTYNKSNQRIISTSIKNEIVIHEVGKASIKKVKLDFNKISNIGVVNKMYIILSWNGMIKFFDFNFEYISNYQKSKSLIQGDLNVIGNLNNDEDIKKKNIKPNAISVKLKQDVNISLNRRDLKLINNDLISIGYDDGTIIIY